MVIHAVFFRMFLKFEGFFFIANFGCILWKDLKQVRSDIDFGYCTFYFFGGVMLLGPHLFWQSSSSVGCKVGLVTSYKSSIIAFISRVISYNPNFDFFFRPVMRVTTLFITITPISIFFLRPFIRVTTLLY